MLKPTLLLATALFLICAPAPDAQVLSEATSNLLIDTKTAPLLAAETDQVTTKFSSVQTNDADSSFSEQPADHHPETPDLNTTRL